MGATYVTHCVTSFVFPAQHGESEIRKLNRNMVQCRNMVEIFTDGELGNLVANRCVSRTRNGTETKKNVLALSGILSPSSVRFCCGEVGVVESQAQSP